MLFLASVLGFASSALAQITFTDVSATAGVGDLELASSTGHSLGVNWIDIDQDGWPDLFVVAGGPNRPPHLFRNRGDGSFDNVSHLLPELPTSEMSGSRFADYDRDGDVDLFIYTDNPNFRVLRNDNPRDGPYNLVLKNLWVEKGRQIPDSGPMFDEVAMSVGLSDQAVPAFGAMPAYRSKTASWLDFDRDGCIDLFVGHLVINAVDDPANADSLYRNRCDGTFEDVTAASGLVSANEPVGLRGALASGAFQLDNDLWPDLYVVNVSSIEASPYGDDVLFKNSGSNAKGVDRFTNTTALSPGLGDDAMAGMGVAVGDINRDGHWDLYITDLLDTHLDQPPRGNVLYLGQGDGRFSDNLAPVAGVVGNDSWGANFFDADSDGWEDLFVSTITTSPDEFLYKNNGLGSNGQVSFTNIATAAGIVTGNARGSAIADYDRDGDLDLAIVNQLGPLQLYRNDTPQTHHWLMLELVATSSNLDAIGSVIEVSTAEVNQKRQVTGGSSAHSQDGVAVHFGMGASVRTDLIVVRWPSGAVSRLSGVSTDQYLTVSESLIFSSGLE